MSFFEQNWKIPISAAIDRSSILNPLRALRCSAMSAKYFKITLLEMIESIKVHRLTNSHFVDEDNSEWSQDKNRFAFRPLFMCTQHHHQAYPGFIICKRVCFFVPDKKIVSKLILTIRVLFYTAINDVKSRNLLQVPFCVELIVDITQKR